jgi:hypothetical protein
VLRIWKRIRERQARIRRAGTPPTYSVRQTVKISNEKMRFAKGLEQNWTLTVLRITKVLRRSPRHVFELEHLRGKSIDGRFCVLDFTPVKITRRIEYQEDKILNSRVRCGIRESLVRWRGYGPDFNSWIPAFVIRRLRRRRRLR